METAGSLELLAAPRSVPLGPAATIPLFHDSRKGLSTGVDPARRPATRCGGSLPHPVCLRPGANPQAPRSFVCLLRESDCGAGSVPLFLRPGTSPGRGCGGSFGRDKLGLRGGGRRRWVAQSAGSAPEKGEGAGGRLQLSTELRPLRDPVSRRFLPPPPGHHRSVQTDLAACLRDFQGSPLGDRSLASLQPLTLFREGRVLSSLPRGPRSYGARRRSAPSYLLQPGSRKQSPGGPTGL